MHQPQQPSTSTSTSTLVSKPKYPLDPKKRHRYLSHIMLSNNPKISQQLKDSYSKILTRYLNAYRVRNSVIGGYLVYLISCFKKPWFIATSGQRSIFGVLSAIFIINVVIGQNSKSQLKKFVQDNKSILLPDLDQVMQFHQSRKIRNPYHQLRIYQDQNKQKYDQYNSIINANVNPNLNLNPNINLNTNLNSYQNVNMPNNMNVNVNPSPYNQNFGYQSNNNNFQNFTPK